MEMSMGTIVTIVLLVSVLVLGIVMIQKIFFSAGDAIDQIDTEITNQIGQLFETGNKKLVIFPQSREITIERGDDPAGFAFSVKNDGVETESFSYEVEAVDFERCGDRFRQADAEAYLIQGEGSFSLGASGKLENPKLVKLDVQESAPACTIVYSVIVEKGRDPYSQADVFVTIK